MALRPARLLTWLAAAPRALVGLLIIVVFLLHPLTHFGENAFPLLPKLEGLAYDLRLKLTLPESGDPQVVIVDIDEASLQREGRWPWSRDKLAQLTTQLFERYGVRAVGFDVLFVERDLSSGITVLDRLAEHELKSDTRFAAALERLRPELDFDARFAAAMRGRGVVLPIRLSARRRNAWGSFRRRCSPWPISPARRSSSQPENGYVASLPVLAEAAAASGHIDPIFDADNLVRRVPMLKRYGSGFFPAMSLAIVQTVVEAKKVKPIFDSQGALDALDVGRLDGPGRLVGYCTDPVSRQVRQTFRIRPRRRRARRHDDRHRRAARCAGAIALVGTSAKALKDLRPDPA